MRSPTRFHVDATLPSCGARIPLRAARRPLEPGDAPAPGGPRPPPVPPPRRGHPLPTILLVKTSSLGDVVHNLPVVTDICAAFPGAAVDWLVEESFADIPRLHPGVRRVITCAVRRWRGSLFRGATWREINRLSDGLRQGRYDAAIDTQGLLKSAWLTRMASGERHGLDWLSSREPLRMFYDHTHRVPWGRHAVVRNRALAAQALGYTVPATLDYGISAPPLPARPAEDDLPPAWLDHDVSFSWLPARPIVVFLHATSAASKLWPEHQWKKLAARFVSEGMAVVLPWGRDDERARAERIADRIRYVVTAPHLGLRALATLLGHARLCVGVDTGLTHFAAALGTPTVGVYVATDPAATGVLAPAHAANVGGRREIPSQADVLAAVAAVA
jgi:heptosyltransferase-1